MCACKTQLTSDQQWLPKAPGCNIPRDTVLGPFLALSGLLDENVGLRNEQSGQSDLSQAAMSTVQQTLSVCRVESSSVLGACERLFIHLCSFFFFFLLVF